MGLSQAQNSSWDLLLDNEFEKAREGFSAEIQADSTNQQALIGALFMADIYRDNARYFMLKRKLLEISEDPLIWSAFEINPRVFFDKKKLPPIPFLQTPTGQIEAKLAKTYQEKDYDYEELSYRELKREFEPIFQNQGWAFIGPFKNVNGEAYLTKLAPEEHRELDRKAVYDNGLGQSVYWITPSILNPIGFINIDSYLPAKAKANLFYAHKTVFLENAQKVQLRISRSSPVKVWVDGELIMENPNPISIRQDGEIMELDLSEGIHEIRLKLTPFSGWKSYRSEFAFVGTQTYSSRYGAEFNARLTDLQGKPLPLLPTTGSQKAGSLYAHRILSKNPADYLLKMLKGAEETLVHPHKFYLLARHYLSLGQSRDVEQYFVQLEERYPNSTYIDLLLAAIYESNGNRAMAYKTISKIDLDQTPFYPLLKKKMEEIDPKVDQKSYEERLEKLRTIAPSNKQILRSYIRHYERQEDSLKLVSLKNQTLKVYPSLESFFDGFDITASEEAKKEKEKKAKKKKNYNYNSPFKKKLEKADKHLKRYPYLVSSYSKKAELYLKEKMWQEAMEVVNQGLTLTPFSSGLNALKGELYKELNQKDSALWYLKLAQYQSSSGRRGYGYYGKKSIKTLIDNLTEEEESLWDGFSTTALEDILEEKDKWSTKYKDEDALVLMHTSRNWIKASGEAEVKENFALLILQEKGIPEWTQKSFTFLGSKVSVEVIKPDGSRVQPERSGAFAVFKNLEVGDIIWAEGSYQYERFKYGGGRYGFSDYGNLRGGKNFKSPVYYQKFVVASPLEEKLLFNALNVPVEVEITEKNGYKYHNWEWYHTPKAIKEDAAYSFYAGTPSINVITQLDWTAFSDWYDRLNYRKLEPNYYLKELYHTIVSEDMSKHEKIVAFYNYITEKVAYSSASFLQSNFEPQEPQITCSAQTGDCKDVATLMLTFLKMADIESYFVLVRASKYLPYRPLPSNIFNHAIVAYVLDGETHYMDLTTDKYPYYVLPEQDHEAWALLIKEGKQDIFQLPNDKINPRKNLVSYDLRARLDKEGTLELAVDGTFKGIESGYVREFVGSADGPKLDGFIQKELNLSFMAGNQVQNKQFTPMDSINAPLEVQMDISAPSFAEKLYGLYIFPMPILERLELFEEFLPTQRQSVMDLNQVLNLSPKDIRVELEIPEGYELFAQPEDVRVENEFGSYELSFKQEKGKLFIHKKHAFRKSKIRQEEYTAFREWYFKVARLDASKIVLAEKGFEYPKR